MIKNVKFSGYYFHMNLNIWGDFQICISVPLSNSMNIFKRNSRLYLHLYLDFKNPPQLIIHLWRNQVYDLV